MSAVIVKSKLDQWSSWISNFNSESKANSGEQEEERNTETTFLGQNATNNFSRIWASSIKFDMNKASQTRIPKPRNEREIWPGIFLPKAKERSIHEYREGQQIKEVLH